VTGLAGLASGGRDQRVKLFLPHPDQVLPVVPAGEDWYPRWRAADPAVRAVMRTYTVRELRRRPDELDIDFVLHGDAGPASRWAARARPDDRASLLAPVVADNAGVDFRPPPGTRHVLLAADATALPAIGGILAWLPAGVAVRAWIEVPDPADICRLPTRADAEVTWLLGGGGSLPAAVRAAPAPAGRAYCWVAGEAGTVRDLRRHLLGERGYDRTEVTCTGYWRRGATEEELLDEAAAVATSG
jgi:NADPH-dependent ferric siderophore reductase